jgi:DNA repair exonuclease SbcCD ATPase subunit
MSIKSIISVLSERLKRATANLPLQAREKDLIAQIEAAEAEREAINADAREIGALQAAQCLGPFSNADGLSRRVSEPVVQGVEWPNVETEADLRAAVVALVKLNFTEERRQYLRNQQHDKYGELGPVDKRLAELREQLNAVQSELSQ